MIELIWIIGCFMVLSFIFFCASWVFFTLVGLVQGIFSRD